MYKNQLQLILQILLVHILFEQLSMFIHSYPLCKYVDPSSGGGFKEKDPVSILRWGILDLFACVFARTIGDV